MRQLKALINRCIFFKANKKITTLKQQINQLNVIHDYDLNFPDILIKYEERSSDKKGEIQINLGTVFLTTSAALAVSQPVYIYRQSIEAIVKKSQKIPESKKIEITDADFERIISLLYAKNIIDLHAGSNWPDDNYPSLEITPLGREILSKIV